MTNFNPNISTLGLQWGTIYVSPSTKVKGSPVLLVFERKSISINFNSLFIRKIKVRGIGARMEGLERRQEEIVRLLNSLRLFRNRQN